MSTATFSIDVSYSQLAVFDAALTSPFNDWTDRHVAQGFSWRFGSVSFKTLDEAGVVWTEVEMTSFNDKTSLAQRVITVPFSVSKNGQVEIASIGSSSALLQLSPGAYDLTFEHGRDAQMMMWCKLHFQPSAHAARAQIIRADDQLHPGEELLMTAAADLPSTTGRCTPPYGFTLLHLGTP